MLAKRCAHAAAGAAAAATTAASAAANISIRSTTITIDQFEQYIQLSEVIFQRWFSPQGLGVQVSLLLYKVVEDCRLVCDLH